MGRKAIGICLGASNIKVVELHETGGSVEIARAFSHGHGSNPREALKAILKEISPDASCFGAFTGRKFKEIVRATSVTEAEAIEHALAFERRRSEEGGGFAALVSLGAESFISYVLNKDGTIASVETGNKCASGTGEFFLQQTKRMDISADQAIALAETAEIYPVSGRCSVFCKSDCTHALNKGIPAGRVAAGLCEMMAEKISELLEKMEKKEVIAVGGVTKNQVVMNYLRDRVDRLHIPETADTFEALGAACFALEKEVPFDVREERLFSEGVSSFSFLTPIEEAAPLVSFKSDKAGVAKRGDTCIVGLDVGSTTTKGVVLRTSDRAVLASEYLRTNGDPVTASRQVYASLQKQLKAPVEVAALGVTGSGRHIAGLHAPSSP